MARTVNFKERGIDLGDKYVDVDDAVLISNNFFINDGIDRFGVGRLYTWGWNNSGQLGSTNNDVQARRSSPVQVGALTDWKDVSSGSYFCLSTKVDSSLWSWGSNTVGQLGLGDVTQRSSPVQVGALTNWQNIAAAGSTSFATKKDGTIWSWGTSNDDGLLGRDAATEFKSSPTQIGTLTNWKDVKAGPFHAFALKYDGTIWSWGRNTSGQLGLNDVVHRSSPVQIGALTNWKQITAGTSISAAIKTDGTLWSWGTNGAGQLGLNDTTHRSSPAQVGALTNWKLVTAGRGSCMFAITNIYSLWSWGSNSIGQLGLNDTTARSSPSQVGTLTNWRQIYSGGVIANSISVKTDGTLWSWGDNFYGELGIAGANQNDRSSPVQIGALTDWKKAFVGVSVTGAIR